MQLIIGHAFGGHVGFCSAHCRERAVTRVALVKPGAFQTLLYDPRPERGGLCRTADEAVACAGQLLARAAA